MGYYVTIEMTDVIIPADKVEACLATVNEMFTDENLTRNTTGGVSGPGITDTTPVKEKKWYSWVGNPGNDGFATLEEAIGAWRYVASPESGDGADVEIEYFQGEKWGDDEQFYHVIAPFVKNGALIEVRGEDGEHWRYVFKDGEIKEEHAVITWE